MPKPDGTLYAFERAELHCAQRRYEQAVNELKMHPSSKAIYESLERKAFANLMVVTAKYAGCR